MLLSVYDSHLIPFVAVCLSLVCSSRASEMKEKTTTMSHSHCLCLSDSHTAGNTRLLTCFLDHSVSETRQTEAGLGREREREGLGRERERERKYCVRDTDRLSLSCYFPPPFPFLPFEPIPNFSLPTLNFSLTSLFLWERCEKCETERIED